jgi:hypothetical protein
MSVSPNYPDRTMVCDNQIPVGVTSVLDFPLSPSGSSLSMCPIAARCGGITGMACPAGQVCADDTTDDCHPAKGDPDCAGICQAGPDPGPGDL